MAVPDFQTLMRPVLQLHQGQEEWERTPLIDALAEQFELTAEERAEILPSGRQRRFRNRVGWSIVYLVKAGVLERPRRGVTRITDRGRTLLTQHPDRVDIGVLEQFEEFREFRSTSGTRTEKEPVPLSDATPEETIDAAYEQSVGALADELLEKVLEVSPSRFEEIVVDLLVRMGYGGTQRDAGERLGRSGDEGIDGVIREDKLGLDAIYLQAKLWKPGNSVGRPSVQGFVGALHGLRAAKGVFITTSHFTDEARAYVGKVEPRVVLIDGPEFARLMIDHDVGVTRRHEYVLKRVDEDYFLDDSL